MKTALKYIQQFKKQNPDFNWQQFSAWSKGTFNALIGTELHAKIKKHKEEEVGYLQAYQRLFRLAQDHTQTEALFEAGYHSAIQIASMAKHEFVKETAPLFKSNGVSSETQAEAIHKAAVSKKSQAVLTFTNIMQQNEKHYKNARFANFKVEGSGLEDLPSYADLFGNVDFCSCESCRSIFSPAAYFVDMMRMQANHITDVPDAFALKTRRPDLWDIPLSCENTNTEISKLEIVNEVLENNVEFSHSPIADPFFEFPLNGDAKNLVTNPEPYTFVPDASTAIFKNIEGGRKALELSADSSIKVGEKGKFPLGTTSLSFRIKISKKSKLPNDSNGQGFPLLLAIDVKFYEDLKLNEFGTVAPLLNVFESADEHNIKLALPRTEQPGLITVGELDWDQTHFLCLVIDDEYNIKVFVDGNQTGETSLTFKSSGSKDPKVKSLETSVFNFKTNYYQNNPLKISPEYFVSGTLQDFNGYKRCLSVLEIQSQVRQTNFKFLLAHQVYPWNLPVNLPLDRCRMSLSALDTSLGSLWNLPGTSKDGKVKFLEEIGLNSPAWSIFTYGSQTDQPDYHTVAKYFGVDKDATITSAIKLTNKLADVDTFIQQTGLSKPEIIQLFQQDLSEAEIAGDLQGKLFINKSNSKGKYLSINDQTNVISNLSLSSLNDINRFVRLSQKIGWSFVELNWVLNCIPGLSDIDDTILPLLAWIQQVKKELNCSIDEATALVGLLKDFGKKNGLTQFHKVFKNKSIPYRPTDWIGTTWSLPNSTAVLTDAQVKQNKIIEKALSAALAISQEEAISICTQVVNTAGAASLSISNDILAVIYRLSRVAKETNFSIHFLTQKGLLNDIKNSFYNLSSLNLTGTQGSYETVIKSWTYLKELDVWMNSVHLGQDHLQFLLTGESNSPLIQNQKAGADAINNFVQNLILAIQNSLITEHSFSNLKSTEAKKILKALCKEVDQNTNPPKESYLINLDHSGSADQIYSCIVNKVPSTQQILNLVNAADTSGWPLDWAESVHNVLIKNYQLQQKSFFHTITKIAGLSSAYVENLITLTGIRLSDLLQGTAINEVHQLQQYSQFIKFLVLSPAELTCVLKHPELFNLESDTNGLCNIPFSLNNLQGLVTFKQLIHELGDGQNHLINAMTNLEQEAISSTKTEPEFRGDFVQRISKIAQWKIDSVTEIMAKLWPEPSSAAKNPSKIEKHQAYNSIEGISTIRKYLGVTNDLGINTSGLFDLLTLDTNNLMEVSSAANGVWSGLQRLVKEENLASLSYSLGANKRDALVPLAMYQLNQKYLEIHLQTPGDLFEYLLIDVEIDSVAVTSRIREAIAAVQLYIYRCLNNLEKCSLKGQLINMWSWVGHYRTWQANREVFLYPENYIEPQLRKSKSLPFTELESALQQIDMTSSEAVNMAFGKYFEGFMEVANLQIVGCGVYAEQNKLTMCFVGRSYHAPHSYFSTIVSMTLSSDGSEWGVTNWDTWTEISCRIAPVPSGTVTGPNGSYLLESINNQVSFDIKPPVELKPVYWKGTWYLYWVEGRQRGIKTADNQNTTDKTKSSALTPPAYENQYDYVIHYTLMTVGSRWSKTKTCDKPHVNFGKSSNWELSYWTIEQESEDPAILKFNERGEILTTWSTQLGLSNLMKLQEMLLEDGIERLINGQQSYGVSNFDSQSINCNYFWELFFHVPFLIANDLSKALLFKEAKKWYRYIFDPAARKDTSYPDQTDNNQYWQFLPLKKSEDPTLKTEHTNTFAQNLVEDLKVNTKELADYHNDPFDPHAIARLRPIAYQKVMVMQYINNLIAWGDSLFKQYTIEDINEAEMLYIMAYDLLGKKPVTVASPPLPKVLDLNQILADEKLDASSTPAQTRALSDVKEFLIQIESKYTDLPSVGTDTPANYIPGDYFGIPENEHFQSYWDTVRQRLYDIRHGLNINGAKEALPLFQPPVSPMALVSQIAAGESVQQALNPFGTHTPVYRFRVVIQKAKEMLGSVTQLGQSLLAALEKKDAEALQLVLNMNQQHIQAMTLSGKQENINQVKANVTAMQTSLKSAQTRVDHYNGLISTGLIGKEKDQINKLKSAASLQEDAFGVRVGAVAAKLLPNIFGFSDGGMDWGGSVAESATILDSKSGKENTDSGMSAAQGSFARRLEDWNLQLELANDDIVHLTSQIHATQYQLRVIEQEQEVLQTSIAQNQKVEAFYKNKFTNQQLYDWMIGKASTLYFQAYQHAVDLGLQAQNAWTFEKGLDTGSRIFIQHQQWDNLHQGLLAGNALQLDLQRMETEFMKQDERRLEITKTIALSTLPSVTQKKGQTLIDDLKAGKAGEPMACTIDLIEKMFTDDYPNLYCRQIKSVSVSIPAVLGPYENIRATLTQKSHSFKNSPEAPPVTGSAGQQKVALSGGLNDTGMFQLNFNDERYLPFEGTGAISTWDLEILNTDLRDSLSDVILEIRYTALG